MEPKLTISERNLSKEIGEKVREEPQGIVIFTEMRDTISLGEQLQSIFKNTQKGHGYYISTVKNGINQ